MDENRDYSSGLGGRVDDVDDFKEEEEGERDIGECGG